MSKFLSLLRRIKGKVETPNQNLRDDKLAIDCSTRDIATEPLHFCLNTNFCGPENKVFNKLLEDINYIKNNCAAPQARFGELAYVLLDPKKEKDSRYLSNGYDGIPFQNWIKIFFAMIGLTPPKDTHRNKYDCFYGEGRPPMKYLDAQSWEEFTDELKLETYLTSPEKPKSI